jgi:hypothetical protein
MQKLPDEALEREQMAEPVAQTFVDAEIEKVAEAQPEPVLAKVEAEIEKVAFQLAPTSTCLAFHRINDIEFASTIPLFCCWAFILHQQQLCVMN